MRPGLEIIKLFSCSTQLNMKFILLINVKMPTIVGILAFISRINTPSKSFKGSKIFYLSPFYPLWAVELSRSVELSMKKFYKCEGWFFLQEYTSILFLKPRMKIILRGLKVRTKMISKSLSKTESDVYKPTWLVSFILSTGGLLVSRDYFWGQKLSFIDEHKELFTVIIRWYGPALEII